MRGAGKTEIEEVSKEFNQIKKHSKKTQKFNLRKDS